MAIVAQILSMFGLEGQWHGAAAVALVITGIIIFVGTIYVLLVAIYGWLQAYLVTMVALASFSIILAAVWLIGIPGTIPGTGPRGTEPSWVAFLPDSEQGQEFTEFLKRFPDQDKAENGWRLPDASENYPGNINSEGEVDNIKSVLRPALAGYFQAQKTGSSNPASYDFRIAGKKVGDETLAFRPTFTIPTGPDVTEDEKLPPARVFFLADGNVEVLDAETKKILDTIKTPTSPHRLLAGIQYPQVRNADGEVVHPAITVFAYRNKGQVFMAALEWMIASILLFALHTWWLAAYEKKAKRREEQLASGALREPVGV